MLRDELLCNTHFYINDFVPLFWAHWIGHFVVHKNLYSRPENLSSRFIAILILFCLIEDHNMFRFIMKSKKNAFSAARGVNNKNYRWFRLVFNEDGPLEPDDHVKIFSLEFC
jgi:hypothetical protein